jgi:hypothetical protein
LRLADARAGGGQLSGQLLGLARYLRSGRLPHGGHALQLLGLAVAPFTDLLGLGAAIRRQRTGPAPRLGRTARHEPQMAAARGVDKDLEPRRGQLLSQPALAELLRAVAIDGGAEEGVGDPAICRRGGSVPLACEQIAGLGDECVQLGALAAQRVTGRSRIAELRPAHMLHAGNERCESSGILVRELIGGPERRTRAP